MSMKKLGEIEIRPKDLIRVNTHIDNGVNMPKKSHPTDAGWDLPSAENVCILPGERRIVDTGVSLETPEGFFAMITPRSGLAAKHGITIVNAPGVIDSHYRGNIKIIMLNTGKEEFQVHVNDRIAQLIFMAHLSDAVLFEVDELTSTDRGAGGFGSTGK